MAHWQDSMVTRSGTEMLNELMFGRRLTVTGAYGGEERVKPSLLGDLTVLPGSLHSLSVLDVENALDGKTVKVQVSNVGLSQGYVLRNIGVYARVDDEAERLLFVMQDDMGVEIPPEQESPRFILDIYGFIGITNQVQFHVDIKDTGGIVTPDVLNEVIQGHRWDVQAHPMLSEELQQLKESVEQAEKSAQISGSTPPTGETSALPGQHYFDTENRREYVCIGEEEGRYIWVLSGANSAGDITFNGGSLQEHLTAEETRLNEVGLKLERLDGRISLLEMMFTAEVSGNPFTATFSTLDGMAVSGIWNTAQSRIEF